MSELQEIYEMFSGRIDQQIIEDVYQALEGNKFKTIGRLLDICPPDGECYPIINEQNNTLDSAVNAALNDIKKNNKNTTPQMEYSSRSTVLGQKDAMNLIKRYVTNDEKVLILLRGCPGSGKSTLARKMRFNGAVLSTDDYISFDKFDTFSFANISNALKTNQELVSQAMSQSKNPIIVDSLNIKISDMLPYGHMADIFGYAIEIIEPDVQWRLKPDMLAKKNIHGVKKDKIMILLNEYDENINGDDLLRMVRQTENMEKDNWDNKNDFHVHDASISSRSQYCNDVKDKTLADTMHGYLTIERNMEDDINGQQTLKFLQAYFPNIDPEIIGSLYNEGVHNLEDLTDILSDIGNQYIDLPKQYQWDENLDWTYYTENEECDNYETNLENNLAIMDFKPLVISKELGDQLLQLFGKPHNTYPSKNGKCYEINVNFELAQMIHKTWTGLQNERWDSQSDSDASGSTKDKKLYDIEEDFPIIDQSNLSSTKIKQRQLIKRFPGIDGSVLKNIFVESGYNMDVAVSKIENTPLISEQLKVSMTKEYSKVLRNSQVKKPTERLSRDNEGSSPTKNYMELIERMRKSESQFKENIGKAKDAFTGKKYSVAHIYSARAQAMKKKFHDEKELCAELLAEQMYKNCIRTGTIDLHGLKIKEAIDLVSSIFSYYGYEISRVRSQISIITGRGMHSDGGVAKIKPWVEQYLKKSNYKYVETNPGILNINLKK